MSNPSPQELAGLLDRVSKATGPDNELDIAIACALFEPDEEFVSVRPNAANTKLVYSDRDGKTKTYWANDWTLNAASRAEAIDALTSLKAST